MQEFFIRVIGIMNQITSYGQDLRRQKNVENILRSLPNAIVLVIEEYKYLTLMFVNELMGYLQFHERMTKRCVQKSCKHIFSSKGQYL